MEGGRQNRRIGTRAHDEAGPGAPGVPWPGLHGAVALMAARSRSTWSGYAPLDADTGVKFQAALSDIREGLRRRRSWSYLAVENVKNRYRRTVFGPWWLTLQMAILIVGISIVFGHLLHNNLRTFLPYVGLGYIAFSLLTGLTSTAAVVFIAGSSTLRAASTAAATSCCATWASNASTSRTTW